MARKASRSRGIRPVRQAWLTGIGAAAGIAFCLMGIAQMRATGKSGSPYLMLGIFPALLFPIGFVYYVSKIPVVRAMRRGTTAIARWTLSADEFRRFIEADERVAAENRQTNFYEPPKAIPPEGVEVIFADDGVLIGDGYFPLSMTGGRRVTRVRSISYGAQMIEFGTILSTRAQTSSTTSKTVRIAETLRVPVASDATMAAVEVVYRFERAIPRG